MQREGGRQGGQRPRMDGIRLCLEYRPRHQHGHHPQQQKELHRLCAAESGQDTSVSAGHGRQAGPDGHGAGREQPCPVLHRRRHSGRFHPGRPAHGTASEVPVRQRADVRWRRFFPVRLQGEEDHGLPGGGQLDFSLSEERRGQDSEREESGIRPRTRQPIE